MKRLLSTTALLSLVLAPVQPLTVMAQGVELRLAEDGFVVAPDGSVLCVPTADLACDPVAIADALNAQAAVEAAAKAEADAAAAAQVAADAEAAAKAEADAAAAAQAAADAEAAAKA
ncbi:MAG: hypothetical protein JXR75_12435, partial [Rhodobacteraceae bacterium]|nr:hypothetical protein [Paracoccaceae bacterium]